MWTEITSLDLCTLLEALIIIDDALCYGFEIKVENHKIYYREMVD